MAYLDAARHPEQRVIGPPGSGKTETVARWVERLVRDGDYDPQDIVLSSYSRVAARELGHRVNVPDENAATLHALCHRELGSPEIAETGARAKEWNELVASRAGLGWTLADAVPAEKMEENEFEQAWGGDKPGSQLELYNRARARLVSDPDHPALAAIRPFVLAWEEYKRETESVDFADMIQLGLNEVDVPHSARVLMVDEAQDLTPLQWKLVRLWAESVDRFVVVGDPAQCIFDFAGADPAVFLRDLPPEDQQLLGRKKTYRLPSVIKDFAETWLRQHHAPIWRNRDYAPRCEGGTVTHGTFATWQHPESMLDEIVRQVDDGQSCMLLATCGYMLKPAIAGLRELGLPFHNPYQRKMGAWNPLALGREGAVSTADRLAAFSRDTWRWLDVNRWAAMLPASGDRAVFAGRGIKKMLERAAAGEAAQKTVDVASDIMPLFKPAAFDRIMATDRRWLADTAMQKYQRPLSYAVKVLERHGEDALSAPPKIVIGTGHSVKGAEADSVFVLPDISRAAAFERAWSTAGHDSMVRLGYVMLTRARERLILGDAADPSMAMSW